MNRAARRPPRADQYPVSWLGDYHSLRYHRSCDHLVAGTRDLVDWIAGRGWPAGHVHHRPDIAPDLLGDAPAGRATLGAEHTETQVLARWRRLLSAVATAAPGAA